MFCTNCGKELKPGSKFCTSCGCPVETPEASEDGHEATAPAADDAEKEVAAPESPDSEKSVPEPAEAEPEHAGDDAEDGNEPDHDDDVEASDDEAGADEPEASADEPETSADEPEAADATTVSAPADATTVVAPAGKTTVVSAPDATTVSAPDATTVVPSDDATKVVSSSDATTVTPAADATTVVGAAPEHDREADTAAAVASFDDVEPAPAPAYVAVPAPPAQPAEAPRKKGHGALIIGIVALVAVLAVGGALYVRVNGLPGFQGTTYTQASPAQVSAKTRVRPKDANGKEMSAYVAYLISTKGQGPEASIDTTPYKREVTDGSDFSVTDFGDVPDGDYTLVIVDTSDGGSSNPSEGSSNRYDVPIHYEHDNSQASDTVDPAPPAPSTDDDSQVAATTDSRTDEQKAADLYLAKCQEYIDQYGEPAVKSYPYDDLATGLAVAKLVDFNGDGMDELLLVYDTVPAPSSDQDALTEDQQKAYKAEVWAYKDGDISKVYDEDGTVEASNGAEMFVTMFTLDGTPCLRSLKIDYATGADASAEIYASTYYTFDGSSFNSVLTLESTYSHSDYSSTYKVNGNPASESDYDTASARAVEGDTLHLVSFKNTRSAGNSASDTVSDTNATLDELKSRSAGNAATTAATTSDQAYTSESVDKSYTITNAYNPSSTQGVMWSYPQFSKVDGSTDSALDTLNAQLAKSCEDDANRGKTWGPATGATLIDEHQDLCASINGSIASVFSVRDETSGGAHGADTSFGTFYDLTTGQAVDATTALNMSASDLQAKGVAGINAFLAKNPSDNGVSSDDISKMASEQDRYVRDDKGTFIITRSYDLGSYSFGSHRIYVMANDPADNAIVGTEVADNY